MFEARFSVYLANAIALAKTIRLKNSVTAQIMNDRLSLMYQLTGESRYQVDLSDPSSWRYYCHLAGITHPADEVITLRSVDDGSLIELTAAHFAQNPATRRAYQPGSRYYKELLVKHPEISTRILGACQPVDRAWAFDQAEGKILAYPSDLVEPQEWNFIEDLQQWIYRYIARWDVPAFNQTHSLYQHSWTGLLHLNLVPAILNIRQAACKTPMAHRFHIYNYLNSHRELHRYADQMTLEQILYFYRNITWINKNPGHQEVFDDLAVHVFKKRQFPLSTYRLKHDESNQLSELRPRPVFQQKALFPELEITTNRQYTHATLSEKQSVLAPGNADYQLDHLATENIVLQDSASNTVITKVLESATLDLLGADVYPLDDILMQHWGYYAQQGIYRAVGTVTHPRTQASQYVNAYTGFLYAGFCLSQACALGYDAIPNWQFEAILRDPRPTTTDLLSIVDQQSVTMEDATALLNTLPNSVSTLSDLDSFVTYVGQIAKARQQQYIYTASQDDGFRRGYLQAMASRLYQDALPLITERGQDYRLWVDGAELPNDDFTRAEWMVLYQDLVSQFTGISDLRLSTLALTHASMCDLFLHLSSYSIQLLREINITQIKVLPINMTRIMKIRTATQVNYQLDVNQDDSLDIQNVHVLPVSACYLQGSLTAGFSQALTLSSLTPMSSTLPVISTRHHRALGSAIAARWNPFLEADSFQLSDPIQTQFNALTAAQQQLVFNALLP